MHTGLSKAKRVDQPTKRKMKITKIGEKCCCITEEPVVETTSTVAEVPVAKSQPDWQKEEPPYYHRDIF